MFQDTTLYPISQSADRSNAYYSYCEHVGHSANFASCQAAIKLVEAESKEAPAECKGACANRTCQAVHMMKEEELAGRALFYIDRKKLWEYSTGEALKATERLVELMHTGKATHHKPSKAKPAPAPAPQSDIERSLAGAAVNIQGAAVNAAVTISTAPAPAVPSSATTIQSSLTKSIETNQPMTPLEMARARARSIA